MQRAGDSGFTLIEVLIALALFSAIGLAGFSVVDGVLRVQDRTEQRLERLGEVQRALHLMTLDFEQMEGGSLVFDGESVTIRRLAPSRESGALSIRYALRGGAVRRDLGGAFGDEPVEQLVIGGASGLRWQFHEVGGGWVSVWPPENVLRETTPDALAVEVDLAAAPGIGGTLRRVIRLPAPVLP